MTIANNPQHVPLVIASLSASRNPHVVVSVTDLAGGSLGDFSVVLDTATRQEDGAVVDLLHVWDAYPLGRHHQVCC